MHPKFQTPKPVKGLFSVASADERLNWRSGRTRWRIEILEFPRIRDNKRYMMNLVELILAGDALHAWNPIEDMVLPC